MNGLLDAALANPWRTLDTVLDGPLHPGGMNATERLLDRADVDTETRLLDVGCGAGEALTAARARGADAAGIDPAPKADRAVRGDAATLPFQSGSVDVILAECVLCLTDLPAALAEANRVLCGGGRIAMSDVVVEDERFTVPEQLAEALCLDGARSRDRLLRRLADAGFEIQSVHDHHDDLLAMRDRITDRVDYRGLLGLMDERGQRTIDAIEGLETAVEAGDVSYVSVVASANGSA